MSEKDDLSIDIEAILLKHSTGLSDGCIGGFGIVHRCNDDDAIYISPELIKELVSILYNENRKTRDVEGLK